MPSQDPGVVVSAANEALVLRTCLGIAAVALSQFPSTLAARPNPTPKPYAQPLRPRSRLPSSVG